MLNKVHILTLMLNLTIKIVDGKLVIETFRGGKVFGTFYKKELGKTN